MIPTRLTRLRRGLGGALKVGLAGAVLVSSVGAVITPGIAWSRPPNDNDAIVSAAPGNRPVRTVTSMSGALGCMDDLFVDYGKQGIAVMTPGITDSTRTVNAGTRSMIITALQSMSQKSGAFRILDMEGTQSDILAVHALSDPQSARLLRPDYYIVGDITQLDQDVVADTRKLGAAIKQLSLGFSKDRIVTLMTIDARVAYMSNMEDVPGVFTHNTLAIVRKGSGFDVEGLVPFGSLNYDVKKDRTEGTGISVRTLIDFTMIELMGQFTRVPYWKCLELPDTDPHAREIALKTFNGMPQKDRVRAVASALAAANTDAFYLADETDAKGLGHLIARYRTEHGLAPSTDIDFALYFSLISNNYAVATANVGATSQASWPAAWPAPRGAGEDRRARATPAKPESKKTGSVAERGDLRLTLTPRETSYRVGDPVHFSVSANRDAFIYCYVQASVRTSGGKTSTMRVYPNRFAQLEPIRAGKVLKVPHNDTDFTLVPQDPGVEQVACIARLDPYPDPPPAIVRAEDLVPMEASLPQVIYKHQSYDPKGLRSVVKQVELRVLEREAQ